MTEITRCCPDCGRDAPFIQHHPAPGCCPDVADGCCTEWICVICGAAVILGDVPVSFGPQRMGRVPARVA